MDGINISRAVHILILIIFTQDYETNGRLDQFVILDFPACPNHSNKNNNKKNKNKKTKQSKQAKGTKK